MASIVKTALLVIATVIRGKTTALTQSLEVCAQVMASVSATSANVTKALKEDTVASFVKTARPAKGSVSPTKTVCSARRSRRGSIQRRSA